MDKPYFEGLDSFAEGTYGCDSHRGCLYNQDKRCIFNIAPIKQEVSRGCYEENRMADLDSEADYLYGLSY